MIAVNTAREKRCNAFFEWLAGIVSPAQLSELYHAFSGLETAATNSRYPHRLSRPLLEETDPAALGALLKDLMSNNRVPRFFKSGGYKGFSAAILYSLCPATASAG